MFIPYIAFLRSRSGESAAIYYRCVYLLKDAMAEQIFTSNQSSFHSSTIPHFPAGISFRLLKNALIAVISATQANIKKAPEAFTSGAIQTQNYFSYAFTATGFSLMIPIQSNKRMKGYTGSNSYHLIPKLARPG